MSFSSSGPVAPAPATSTDVVILGGGIAGISLALRLPATTAIILLTKHTLGESNTRYAQGGLAAAVGPFDHPANHMRDTLRAGAGHCDEDAVRLLTAGGPDAVAWLVAAGTHFDPANATATPDDTAMIPGSAPLALGHEAAHSHHRVLHAMGDATGAEIERALVDALHQRPNITIMEHTHAIEVLVQQGQSRGVVVLLPDGRTQVITARAVVLANGGAGQLWKRTSNPAGATADGMALAFRAGAALTDLEFAQFHPTVLVPPDPTAPAFLISEAVRGEGAYLRNHAGERFMAGTYPDAELEPRDVVARAILQEMLREESEAVYLDLRHLDAARMLERFPTIAATCAQYQLDITTDLIPIAPAAHYFMGGVAVDLDARTTVPGLWAVGEVACTGVHGANRLASNSLLEGVVYGMRAAGAIASDLAQPAATWPTTRPFPGTELDVDVIDQRALSATLRPAIQAIMWERAGLYRDAAGLARGAAALHDLARNATPPTVATPAEFETANLLTVAQLIVAAAQARHESRGAHARRDFPAMAMELAGFHYFASLQGVHVSSGQRQVLTEVRP